MSQVPKEPSDAAPQGPELPPQGPEPPPQGPEPPPQGPEPPHQAPEPPPQAPEPPHQAPEPPLLTIKDEPEDEGYDVALLPHTSIGKIKEEHKDVCTGTAEDPVSQLTPGLAVGMCPESPFHPSGRFDVFRNWQN